MFQLYMLIIIMIIPTIIMTIAYSCISREILQMTKKENHLDRCQEVSNHISSQPFLREYQVQTDLAHITSKQEEQETKFISRFSTFHHSFPGKKYADRKRKIRLHTLSGESGQQFQTRANYSKGNSRRESFLRREHRNQAHIRKVGSEKMGDYNSEDN